MKGIGYTLFWMIALLGLISCRSDKKVEAVQTEPTLPRDFEVFYEKFHLDTAFQLSHIVFPLEGMPARKDGEADPEPDFKWQKEGWILHKPYSDMGGTFSRSFLSFNDIVTEEISDGTGQFTMMRRFAKVGGDWNLIYYKELGR
ncbi:MAG: hypothetical protein IPN29_06185 [Saprospiraceae bacterium]|nr:hypothetical protein [Saprospiraceae bacterium]